MIITKKTSVKYLLTSLLTLLSDKLFIIEWKETNEIINSVFLLGCCRCRRRHRCYPLLFYLHFFVVSSLNYISWVIYFNIRDLIRFIHLYNVCVCVCVCVFICLFRGEWIRAIKGDEMEIIKMLISYWWEKCIIFHKKLISLFSVQI